MASDATSSMTESAEQRRDRRYSYAAVLATISVFGFVLGVSYPMLSLSLEAQGVSNSMIGLNTAMEAFGVFAFAPAAPRLAARLGAFRFLIACLILTIACMFSFGVVKDPIVWMPLRFVLGAAIAGLFMVSESWVNSVVDDAHRGKALSIYVTFLAASFAVGPLLVPVLGFEGLMPYVVCALIVSLALIPLILARRVAPALNEGPQPANVLSYIARLPTIMGAILLVAIIDYALVGLLPVYALKLDFSSTQGALMLAAVAIGNVVVQFPIGWLADRINRYSVLLLCAGVGLLGGLALPFAITVPWLLWPLLLFWGGTMYGLYTVTLVLMGERYQGAELMAVNATSALVWGIGGVLGPLIGGGVMDIVGPHGLPMMIAAASAIFLIVAIKRHPGALFGR